MPHTAFIGGAMKCTHFILLSEAWKHCQGNLYVDVRCVLNFRPPKNIFLIIFSLFLLSMDGPVYQINFTSADKVLQTLGNSKLGGWVVFGKRSKCPSPKINEALSTSPIEVVWVYLLQRYLIGDLIICINTVTLT